MAAMILPRVCYTETREKIQKEGHKDGTQSLSYKTHVLFWLRYRVKDRHRLESIYAQRDRERESSWLFDLITYKTRQPINNVFDKSAIMFAIYDQKKSRKKCSLDIYIYIEKRVNLPGCEFDAICKTSQP